MRRLLDEIAGDPLARTTLLLGALAVALLLRAASLGTYPLTDTTEARYGEIARVMLQTGNWLTPQEAPGTAFWAKPPLFAWLSAASMAALGVNEFAARLPSFALALATGWLTFAWARAVGGAPITAADRHDARERGLIAAAVLATSPLFFVSAGAVMTDPALACVTAFILVAFHRCVISGEVGTHDAFWKWGLFVAAGLGMLAKGPVIAIYAGLPIALWAVVTRRVAHTWRALPWGRGALVFAAVWLPWYVAAEMRTPGFLGYFLLGEHVLRFVRPGWHGDLYGRAHPEPLGAVWVHLTLGLGAWALMLPAMISRRRHGTPGAAVGPEADQARRADDPAFLLLCALAPIALLTFSRNLIWTYSLPVLPPLAVLIARALEPGLAATRRWRLALAVLLPLSVAALGVAFVAWIPAEAAVRSTRSLVATWKQEAGTEPGLLAYWGVRPPFSLAFYSAGRAVRLPHDASSVSNGTLFVLVDPARMDELTAWVHRTMPGRVVEQIASNGRLHLVEVEHRRAASPGPSAPKTGDGRLALE